jgi:hypothetical protein
MFAARWCGDLPELQFARTILEDKFGGDLAAIAKEGTGIVDPMVTSMNLANLIIDMKQAKGIPNIFFESGIPNIYRVGLCYHYCSWCGSYPATKQTWSLRRK